MLNSADITARLSHSLHLARTEAGMSHDTLADKLGVPARQLRRWEDGRVRIPERRLLAIVAILGHDLSWWFTEH